MNTIAELEIWLEENCYSFQSISIGHHAAYEGIIIEHEKESFNWCYSERGNKTIIASFTKEKELVDYAVEHLSSDRWLKAHMLGFTFDETKIEELGSLLSSMKIEFERNDIPNYSKGQKAYRIFVFGCDITKVEHLKAVYMFR